ncbi:hypothetical protein FIU97_02480 [Roseivivax sp. THAF40]|uniref:hypothetical protein n=1 Tax=unclassified Roseivivax TaxID=2639302 RepID=UPI0012686474|nr:MULTISPECIES: hypothetical protein [unclassified Roseivivax]QFS81640.1 hypothetical protein FIV09_02260 [Roseivivax sp. THAF197b]QFT45432.1 hypothetical protein FIU97_02480 [Roseivivax sp. THAF40]
MKRFMTATALTLALTAPAYAATDGEVATIQSYLPEADISGWSDAQVSSALNIIYSNDSRADITGKLSALYADEEFVPMTASITEAEIAILDEYVDGVDYTMLPQPTVDAAIAAAQSGDESDRADRVRALLQDDGEMVSEMNTATTGEVALISSYAPEVDVMTLSDAEVNSALAIIYSNDSRGDISGKLNALFN